MRRFFALLTAILAVLSMAALTTPVHSQEPVVITDKLATPVGPAQCWEAPDIPEDFENEKIEDALLTKATKIEDCTVTWYCNSTCGKSPDNPAYGITASGKPTRPHCTVATDTSVIPMYSDVCVEYADGTTEWFKATDTGVSGAHVDIYTDDYDQAIQNGVQLLTVYYIPPVDIETN